MAGPSQRDEWPGRGLLDAARQDGEEELSTARRARQWSEVRSATIDGKRGGAWLIPALAGAAAVAAAVMLLPSAPAPTKPPAVVIATAQGHPVVDGATLTADPGQATPVQFRKPAKATLAGRARATFRSQAGGDRVRLHAGSVAVEVTPGAYDGGAPFAVEAGGYQVRVVGTAFAVEVDPDGAVGVSVERGVVEVSGPGLAGVKVAAAQCWSSAVEGVRPCVEPEPAPAPVAPAADPVDAVEPAAPDPKPVRAAKRAPRPAKAAPPAVAPPPPAGPSYDDALGLLAAGDPKGAAAAFAQLSRSDDMQASQALYELAVLQAGPLGDPRAALRSFDAYRRRFPRGELGPEADLGRLQTLVSLGRNSEALTAAAGYLSAHPKSPKRHEVRTLRGDTLHALGRHLEAVAEYDAVTGGRYADKAAWGAVVCLTDAGRTDEARARAERYLQRFPAGRYADRARKALDKECLNAGPAGGHSDTVNKHEERR